ncbi:unnamed protein product [Lepeophtheirus salmonis]|uniref:(salmon louse) hypothetical protein n=1 Tax=Lepeophtheirus salmonis TaxID=72036 RepID=A0A7R8CZ87_LEPSM|nr:unnamed protein product [Lepeophtheirus salmonis]CAF2973736.1 unnamed protein product [Lepeophtheirus salmonis]
MELSDGGFQLPSISDELIQEAEQKGVGLFLRMWKELQESGKVEEMTEDTNWSLFAPMNDNTYVPVVWNWRVWREEFDGEETTLQNLEGSSITIRNEGGSLMVNDSIVKETITTPNATILVIDCNLFTDTPDCGKSRVVRSPFLRVINKYNEYLTLRSSRTTQTVDEFEFISHLSIFFLAL